MIKAEKEILKALDLAAYVRACWKTNTIPTEAEYEKMKSVD